MNILADLFLTFSKIGLFTFGGGYAMISMIENICVKQKRWITHDEMMTVTVIAESTPGPIAINCATFVGRRQAGFPGAVAATVGIVVPAFAVICILSAFLDHVLEISLIANGFRGVKIAVGLLILDAGLTMVKKMKAKAFPRVIAAASFTATLLAAVFHWKLASVDLMLLAAAVSLAVSAAGGTLKRKGGA